MQVNLEFATRSLISRQKNEAMTLKNSYQGQINGLKGHKNGLNGELNGLRGQLNGARGSRNASLAAMLNIQIAAKVTSNDIEKLKLDLQIAGLKAELESKIVSLTDKHFQETTNVIELAYKMLVHVKEGKLYEIPNFSKISVINGKMIVTYDGVDISSEIQEISHDYASELEPDKDKWIKVLSSFDFVGGGVNVINGTFVFNGENGFTMTSTSSSGGNVSQTIQINEFNL